MSANYTNLTNWAGAIVEITERTDITGRTEITEETNRMDVTERTEITDWTGGDISGGEGGSFIRGLDKFVLLCLIGVIGSIGVLKVSALYFSVYHLFVVLVF